MNKLCVILIAFLSFETAFAGDAISLDEPTCRLWHSQEVVSVPQLSFGLKQWVNFGRRKGLKLDKLEGRGLFVLPEDVESFQGLTYIKVDLNTGIVSVETDYGTRRNRGKKSQAMKVQTSKSPLKNNLAIDGVRIGDHHEIKSKTVNVIHFNKKHTLVSKVGDTAQKFEVICEAKKRYEDAEGNEIKLDLGTE